MSHRVTVQTDMKDRSIALNALKAAGIDYRESGNSITLLSGQYNNATLNLATGQITGDTDWGHDSSKLGLLRQHYGEAKYRAEAVKQGIEITSRSVNKDGDVVLMCRMGLAARGLG
jgi:hypothetical protein